MNLRATARRALGFSLIEVMIALLIVCVGMLGIAKLEAVVLSNTGSSRLRALIALEAASLADTMHANRDFWDGSSGDWTSTVGATITVTGGTAAFSATNSAHLAAALGASPNCTSTCSHVNLAGYDLNQWASGSGGNGGLAQVIKNSTSTISCIAQTALVPATCTITITWNENTVAANQQEAQAGAPTNFQSETYTMVVQP
ncbi:MAG TPA: prepilin-type N-terminal cleavage/methylation domain-containing protein [Steroidobacteraceae bacterium]|jgi:type IV pilus assembly protein PilV